LHFGVWAAQAVQLGPQLASLAHTAHAPPAHCLLLPHAFDIAA
jgi:hypothetical protein